MADEEASDNRTEEPTPRRRQQARDEGRVVKSPEFAAAMMLIAGTLFLANFGGRAIGRFVLDLFAVGPNWLLVEEPFYFMGQFYADQIRCVCCGIRLQLKLVPLWLTLIRGNR